MTDVALDKQEPSAPKQTYKGSCHCGSIRYQIQHALPAEPSVGRCNCTICTKTGFTFLRLPETDFTLISPSCEAELSDYIMRSKEVHHFFCNKCGVHTHCKGSFELNGQRHQFFSVNFVTLEQPQEGLEFNAFKVQYCCGRDDSFKFGDGPFPGGMP